MRITRSFCDACGKEVGGRTGLNDETTLTLEPPFDIWKWGRPTRIKGSFLVCNKCRNEVEGELYSASKRFKDEWLSVVNRHKLGAPFKHEG